MRRLREGISLRIDRPFTIVVQEDFDLPGTWVAHVIGHGLDNMTQGKNGGGPLSAVEMAHDMLRLLTCQCTEFGQEHDLSIDGGLRMYAGDDELGEDIPSKTCGRCGMAFSDDDLVEVPDV